MSGSGLNVLPYHGPNLARHEAAPGLPPHFPDSASR
jgi:hypothetical protein